MDSCRQSDAAPVGGEERRRIDRARKSHRQLRKEGPPLRRARRAGRRQRSHPGGALSAYRDLPAARAGRGLIVIPRESGVSSTPRLYSSTTALEYWVARSSRAMTIARAVVISGHLLLRIPYRAPDPLRGQRHVDMRDAVFG